MSSLVLGWETPETTGTYGFGRAAPPPPAEPTLITDASEAHVLCVAPTGAGKTRGFVIPNLLHWDGPAVVIDIKGELARVTARHRREALGQEVVIIDPWRKVTHAPDRFNPLEGLAEGDLTDNAFQFAQLLCPPENGRAVNEYFWNERASSLVAGLLAYVASFPGEGERALHRVWSLLHADDTPLKLAQLLDDGGKEIHPFALGQIGSLLNNRADNTQSGILVTAQSHLRIFGSDTVREAVSSTSFDLGAVHEGRPMTIYFVLPPEVLQSHASLIRLWLSALMSVVTRRAHRPEKPTLFVIDEFAQLGHMPQVVSAVALARSFGMRLMLMVQSLGQLARHYPADHQTILENCGIVLTFGHTLRTMSNEMAAALGDLSAERMARLAPDEAALKRPGRDTEVIRRLDYLADPLFAGRFERNPSYDPPAPLVSPPRQTLPASLLPVRDPADKAPRRIRELTDHVAAYAVEDRVAAKRLQRPPALVEEMAIGMLALEFDDYPKALRLVRWLFDLAVHSGHLPDAEQDACGACLRKRYLKRAEAVIVHLGGRTREWGPS